METDPLCAVAEAERIAFLDPQSFGFHKQEGRPGWAAPLGFCLGCRGYAPP